MAKTTSYYEKRITEPLKAAGKNVDCLSLQISELAITLRTVDLCKDEINRLTSTTITETTRNGETVKPHPVFRTLKDAQETATRKWKAIGMDGKSVQPERRSRLEELLSTFNPEGDD